MAGIGDGTTRRHGPRPVGRGGRAMRAAARAVMAVTLVLTLLLGGLGLLAVFGPRSLALPGWMLAEAEARMTQALVQRGGAGMSVSLGAIAADAVGGAPRLTLRDVRLNAPDGTARLRLPMVEARFDPVALARAQLRLTDLAVPGARIRLHRDADGRFDVSLGEGSEALSLAALSGALQGLFALPELGGAVRLAATGATLALDDRRTGRVWTAGDGRILLERGEGGALNLEAGLALVDAGGRAQVSLRLDADGAVRLRARIDDVAAGDLAAQSPALGWLSLVDAPLSGRLEAGFDAAGALASLSGALDVAEGAIRADAIAAPVPLDRAGLRFAYDPASLRITLDAVRIESPTLRLAAEGHVSLVEMAGARPGAFVAQVSLADVSIDPAGTFAQPMRFDAGAVDLRLRLDPFALDIGQLVLLTEGRRMDARGRLGVDPAGWRMALDATLDAIPADRLLMLWPVGMVPGTRAWLMENVQRGTLEHVRLALRSAPGAAAALSLGYRFSDAEVRLLPGLPPVTGAFGHAALEAGRYALVLDAGRVEPPQGRAIDVAGSVFEVADIMQVPGIATVTVAATGSVTAILSLIDQPPFRFVTAAGMAPDIAAGTARLEARATLPLVEGLTPADVDFSVAGTLERVQSGRLIPGRRFAAPVLSLAADPTGISIGGAARIDGVAADAVWRQPFAAGTPPPATVTGWIALDDAFARAFLPGLPEGTLAGDGRADVVIDLPRGGAARLRLTSDLARAILRLPAVGWDKPAAALGRLVVEGRVGAVPAIERLLIEAPGLAAAGSATFREGGALGRLTLDRVRLGDWLDAGAVVEGDGGLALTGGSLDLRRLPGGPAGALAPGQGGGAGPPPLTVALDRVQVTDAIALTGVSGRLGGQEGRFTGALNGRAPVRVQIEARAAGPALRMTADDAGAVLAAAGLFERARGGAFDLVLVPRAGGYDGRIVLGGFRVSGMPVLAELLNAVSIIGLIDQLQGNGLPFSRAEAGLRLDGPVLRVIDGVAEGPSFGVTLQGIYDSAADRLEMDGVLSPLYIVNGIGQVLSRPGEGMFGFNYRLSGPAARPRVSVNPLSVLAPGFLRSVLRAGDGTRAGRPPPPDAPQAGDR